MKKQLSKISVWLFLMLIGMAGTANAAFSDIKADLTSESLLPTSGVEQWTDVSTGIAVAADGTLSRVDKEGASVVFNGKWHGTQYGWAGFTASVQVEGCVKITYGNSNYGSAVVVTNSDGTEVAKLNNKAGNTWSASNSDLVTVAYYRVNEATTLTFSKCDYVGYFAVEAIAEADLPAATTTYSVTFKAGEGEGLLPDSKSYDVGTEITLPANTTLYKEGYTFTGWTDGTALYKAGDKLTVSADVTLTAQFAANTVAFSDRTEAVTLTWQFGEANGVGVINYQGRTGWLVTQATIGGETIDVKMDIDATSGKLNNVGRGDKWAQCNDGTKLTIPAYTGTVVTFDSYSDGTGTTIGGIEATGKTATYAGTDATLDIVAKGMGYIASVSATYAVPETKPVSAHTWDFTQWSTATVANLKTDAAASSSKGWSDIEKAASTEPTEASKDNCFWYVGGEAEPTANGTAIAELKGLEFNATYGASRSLAIAVNYPEAFSTYAGPAYLWLGGKGQTCFTIKNVKVGSDLTVKAESHKTSEGRGIQLFVGDQKVGEDFTPTTAAEKTWNISADQFAGAETVDVVVKNTNGCHIYYIDAEIIEPVVAAETTVTFDITEAEAEGVAPEAQTVETGSKVVIPANYTLYKDGYTLTAWTDGTTDYAAGDAVVTKGVDVTLKPVFTKNTFSLASRTAPVTVKWNFRRDQGAPTVGYQNQTGLWVAQAEVNGNTIDVKADFDTNNGGKFANGNWTDWAQLNGGTKFTIPSCKGATVSMEAFSEISTTTIDGQTDYTSGTAISYEIAGSAETVDVVIGNGSYYRYIQVVLPVVESAGGGKTFVDAVGSISWAVGNEVSGTVSENAAGAVSNAGVSTGADLKVETATYFDTQMVKYTPANSNAGNVEGVMIEYRVKAAAGVTFKPTDISYAAVKVGTDGATYSWSYVLDGTESSITEIEPKKNLLRNDGSNSSTAKLMHEETLKATAVNEFALRFYISKTANNKNICIGNVTINGVFNGTVADVAKYTLDTKANLTDGGSINVYPVSETYEEDSEVTLTATENFGYDFVNWTDKDGTVVSEEAKFKYTVKADAELTANFKKVETYELKLTVDGTNDYMVAIDPAPTVVDGKNMYEAGAAVQLTANQYDGLVTFTNWSDGETGSSKLISMTENVELTAYYAEKDIIAGWDFYTSGNSGRKADFAAQDNDADALNLVNTETGETNGWLDKSTQAGGGYESFKGAAVNWRTGASNGDVGYYHWQTKVNAEQFTDIKVQFLMMYNYNAYQTYNAEWSLDGENWTKFGSISMTDAKAEASFSQSLPSDCNNQKDLYIRMIADKTSKVAGSASANDGNTLAMFFITGTPKLVDDGVAPVLVSTVPAEGAEGASATGKIVLTFDERVKLAGDVEPTATLGGQTLTPVVSGKTVTFEYKGLEYSTEYTFTLPGNSVADLTDNFVADPITLSFTTMVRPSVTKGLYDYVVENVDDLLAAISAAESRTDKNVRYRIFIKNGEYTIPVDNSKMVAKAEGYEVPECITFLKAGNVSFIGESRDGVIITNGIDKSETFAGTYGTTSKYDGIGNSDVFQIQSSVSGLYWQDLTVETGMDDATGRDLAIHDKGTKNVYKNVGLRGYQDTWTSNNNNGLYYFEDGYVRGRTDYMCGKGDIFWNRVELRQIAGGYAAVPSTPAKIGWVYKDCVINAEGSGVDGKYTLGRPWGKGTPVAVFIDTKMNVVPSAVGWNEMSGGWPARFAEYNSTTKTGSVVDLSGRKKTFADTYENNPVLTAAEALEYSDLHKMYGDWDPTLLTEQAPVPQNVKQTGKKLTWDDSNYALLWAVVKDGKVVDFTTEPAYTLTETGEYAVRAANEMGGLSEVSATVAVTELPATVSVKLNANGYATLASDKALNFADVEGLTAYIVATKSETAAELKEVTAVPAETGLVLKGEASAEYEIPVAATAEAVTGNLLKAAVSVTTVDAKSVYVLDGNQFKVFSGREIPAGKAYLPKTSDSRLLDIVLGDATGISEAEALNEEGSVYSLSGQKVVKPAKGVYIVGGKKVVVK